MPVAADRVARRRRVRGTLAHMERIITVIVVAFVVGPIVYGACAHHVRRRGRSR